MLRVCLAAVLCLIFVSCEEKEDDKIFSAQTCLDKATPATVDSCVAIINGITTSRSYIIRCAARFKKNGLDTTTIVQAIEQLDNPAGNAAQTLYNELAFSTNALATQAVNDCRATGSSTLLAFANAASMATYLNILADDIAGGNLTNIDTNNPSDQDLLEVADKFIAFYADSCLQTSPFKDSEVCTDMTAAKQNINPYPPTTDAAKKQLANNFLGTL